MSNNKFSFRLEPYHSTIVETVREQKNFKNSSEALRFIIQNYSKTENTTRTIIHGIKNLEKRIANLNERKIQDASAEILSNLMALQEMNLRALKALFVIGCDNQGLCEVIKDILPFREEDF